MRMVATATRSPKSFRVDCSAVPRQNSDLLSNEGDKLCVQFGQSPCKTDHMLRLLRLLFVPFAKFFRSRRDLLLENLALRSNSQS